MSTAPGVYPGEIDRTGITITSPTGPAAGVIGTADSGPAFVPVTVGSGDDFTKVFGSPVSTNFGSLAAQSYFDNAASPSALTYLRVLGIGDGQKRNSSTGQVTNSGFVVGNDLVQENGFVGPNPYAVSNGIPGRTYFLGCFMSESAGSTVFSDAGIQEAGSNRAHPILRAVLLTPSGVSLKLSSPNATSNSPSKTLPASNAGPAGALTGSVDLVTSNFALLLNGFNGDVNIITASFDISSNNHFSKNSYINRDPARIQEKGHYLYAYFDVAPQLAVITGSSIITPSNYGGVEPCAFITTGSIARDTSNSTTPNYENFRERFTHTKTPYFVSQDFGGVKYDLFRIHAIGDGNYNNTRFVYAIEGLVPGLDDNTYGSFNLVIYSYPVGDVFNLTKVAGGEFTGLTLDPESSDYIARRIGDQHTYFDFDKGVTSQKIVTDGDYPVTNPYIRVEMSAQIVANEVPIAALPMGHRGYGHLVTSGSEL